MFDPIEQRPPGFNGHPLVTLLVALLIPVGVGILTYYIGKWLQLSESVTLLIPVVIMMVVYLVWHRIDQPK